MSEDWRPAQDAEGFATLLPGEPGPEWRPEVLQREILAELRAIHALLQATAAQVNICPHGGIGVCMPCLILALQ